MSFCSFNVPLRRFLLGSLSLTLVGCIEMEEKFTLNPDESGKFSITQILDMERMTSAVAANGGQVPARTDHDLADYISDTVKQTKGVDVWAEANGKILPDGRWEVKLQGYFKSFTTFRLLPMHPRTVMAAFQKDEMAPPVNLTEMKIEAAGEEYDIQPAATKWLKFRIKGVKSDKKPAGTTPAPPIDPKQKAIVDQAKPKLVGSKLTTFYNFGQGEITSAETFTRVNSHTAKIETDFSYMVEHGLAAMNTYRKPDAREEDIIAYANCPFPAGKAAKEIPRLVVKTKGPAFPYAEESAKAKASQSPALKKLLEEAKAAPGKK